MFHVRRRPNDNSAQAQAARRRKKKLSGSGGSVGGGSIGGGGHHAGVGGGSSSSSLANRLPAGQAGMMGDGHGPPHSPDDLDRLPYLVELNPDGSEVRQGGVVRRHLLAAAVTEVGSERPAPPHPSSPIAGNLLFF